MYTIIDKEQIADKVFRLVVQAPLIAKSRRAGHFVVVRVGEKGERIPLTIAEGNKEEGTITLIVQVVGYSTAKLCRLSVGDALTDIVGPLGQATHIENYGTVLCAGGGVGVAPLLPIVRALKETGNRVVAVIAARTKNLLVLEEEMRAAADEVIVMTDDGTYGQQGVVTIGMEQVIQREQVDKCFAIGPAVMMKYCCLLTKKYGIPTDVSLNTIMVDGTGMCGACRVTVGGKTRFVCVDGPEFDGHEVDFDEMMQRLGAFKDEEQKAMLRSADEGTMHIPSDAIGAAEGKGTPSNEETPLSALVDYEAAWRKEVRASLKAKERMVIARCQMNELAPAYRATTLTEEVNIGLTEMQALTEAKRCLDCRKPTCVEGCPVGIDIPSFIKNIERKDYLAAARVLKATSALPAVCGRVCPQEKQCESHCIHLKMHSKPVAIGYLERFAADYERLSGQIALPSCAEKNDIKVAVVGSGPAGLSCAGDLAKMGYDVTVFEALHEIGGVLKYGIPQFRLPNNIVDVEIDNLRKIGVTFVKDCVIGKTISIAALKEEGFKAIFVATGAGLPTFMNIPGENAVGIMSSNEYLTRVNLMDASNAESDTPITVAHTVMVVGGGNTAMDACRTAKRLGAGHVYLVYRRSEEEMPARAEEVKHAKEEGIDFLTLHNPLEYHCDEKGAVREAVLQVMMLGEPDSSGRRAPIPVDGKTVTLAVDQVIVAVGVSPNPIVPTSVSGLSLGRKNTIVVNEQMQSSIPMLFAGGDIVRGGATVILAMGDGRRAAAAIHDFLN